MLVVISIIGVLAALTVPAVMAAHAKRAEPRSPRELNQLESACKAYKEKFGEYPPRLQPVGTTRIMTRIADHMTYQAEVESGHSSASAKAFPHYQPGISTGTPTGTWNGLMADINAGWGINICGLSNTSPFYFSPATALAFWLGGQPNWRRDNNGNVMTPTQNTNGNSANFDPLHPVQGFLGFSANPLNPFDGGPSHIAAPFFDFNIQRFNGYWYWPDQADGSKRPATATTPPAR